MPPVSWVRSAGYGGFPVVRNVSTCEASASRNAAPGGGGRKNRHDCGFFSPSTRAANVSSATCPSSCRTVPFVPSAYSIRNAIGPFTKLPHVAGRGNRLQLERRSPALRDRLRPSACSSSSHDQAPSSPAFHTASPCRQVTAFTPWFAFVGSELVNRRSTIHWSVSS